MNGITFREDCLIGATDALERWACNASMPYITPLAYMGILTKTLVVLVAFSLIVALLIHTRTSKRQKPRKL